jgi:hypothetical protein
MTITLTFGTWMIPFGITALSFIVAWATTFLLEEDYWGVRGVISVIAIFAGLAASISSWITWGLMLLLK